MDEKRNGRSMDDFWDLSALVPQKKEKVRAPSRVSDNTQAVEISVPARESERPYRVEDAVLTEHYVTPQLTREKKAPKPSLVYAPKGGLLHEVRVYPWRTSYDYYETFRRHAHGFREREGTPTTAVEFFSYMPQYSQMNAAQLAYYFWWRTNFRKGVYLSADYSYLLLYLYELINTGDVAEPREIQNGMVTLWLAYRDVYPRLDALVREWLCDYSLLFQLSPPVLPPKQYKALLAGCRLKEYYVPLEGEDDALLTAVLLFCNNYDYTKSKFFTPESAPEYHRVLRGAVGVTLSYLRKRDGNVLTGGQGVSTISRDTFTGAICSYRLKRHIEVEYTSFSHTHELRYIISDVLKYAENALRTARGIKSKLTIYAVEVPLREELDAYLATALPPKTVRARAKKEEVIPEYERRYDLPVSAPSLTRAAEIEAESWQTTKRLVEAFGGEELVETPDNGASFSASTEARVPEAGATGTTEDGLAAALGELCEFVRLAARGDAAAQRAYARLHGKMLDAIVDEINTVAGDILGDIILEEADGAFAVIEDYLDQLEQEGVL